MSESPQELIGGTFILIGVVFALVGSIGLNRLPDFFTRAHAATKPDTLGLLFTMVGLAVLNGFERTSGKLLLIVIFVVIANPAAAHALGRSAVRSGIQPWVRADRAKTTQPKDTEGNHSE